MSIHYYQENADAFIADTFGVDMDDAYKPFLSQLAPGSLILDLGCGSGRDSLAFSQRGFKVDAIDASSEIAKKASERCGVDVKVKRFDQIDEVNHYDAIWSCASLLHVPEKSLLGILQLICEALKSGGIMYVSFKYGESQRTVGGRLFTDMNESKFDVLIGQLEGLSIQKYWLSSDKRPGKSESWLNILVEKQ